MRVAALVLGAVLLTAGCGPDEGNGPWADGAEQAPAGGTIGGAGPCPLPVTMSIAKDWKPKAVPSGTYDIGGAQLACEVDAKPAGHVGFLRVYVTPGPAEPKALLAKFLADAKQRKEDQYRDSAPGVELTYVSTQGDPVRRRAYAIPATGHTVVVVLDAFDSEEYDAMVGAFLLAQHSLR